MIQGPKIESDIGMIYVNFERLENDFELLPRLELHAGG